MQKIGIVHHLSSSGGTVISKCIAALPDVVLLSEMHPLTVLDVPHFLPIDPLAQLLSNYPQLAPDDENLQRLFCERLEPVAETCQKAGKHLVLRDHSHSDYLTDREPRTRLADALGKYYELRRIVTLRNPIDAWLSMKASGFDNHVLNFSDYCDRVLTFLEDHAHLPLWRYEDFVARPETIIAEISKSLDVPFDPSFLSHFAEKTLTGDSGRKPTEITELPRRDYSESFAEEVAASESFGIIANRFGYAARSVVRSQRARR